MPTNHYRLLSDISVWEIFNSLTTAASLWAKVSQENTELILDTQENYPTGYLWDWHCDIAIRISLRVMRQTGRLTNQATLLRVTSLFTTTCSTTTVKDGALARR